MKSLNLEISDLDDLEWRSNCRENDALSRGGSANFSEKTR